MYNLRLAQKYPTQVIILRPIIVAFHRKFCYLSLYNHHKVLAFTLIHCYFFIFLKCYSFAGMKVPAW